MSSFYAFVRCNVLLLLCWCTIVFSWAQASSNACVRGTEVHIVILGSSTAAGTGPSNRDSTWVNRYRAHLQQLNPNNRVTNLARGGTTTYHIMPDSFVTPSGRPATDSTRNVSQALRLQPDAIIINMPSNDASFGFLPPEQLQNFRLLAQVANDQGVPVWVCTTQPRFFSDPVRIATQVAVRDSIFQVFGPRVLDFWSGFADTSNYIKPIYDSGDGVHMNDAAHGILMQRVQQANLLGYLADTLPNPEWVALDLYTDPTSICGESALGVYIVVGNAGQVAVITPNVHLAVTTGGTPQYTPLLVQALPPCGVDTLHLPLNTAAGGSFSLQAHWVQGDTFPQNDTTQRLQVVSLGQPSLRVEADTGCVGDDLLLHALGGTATDTVLWYDQPVGGQVIGTGPQLLLPQLQQSQTVYPTQIRGPLHYVGDLAASPNTNVNWNGVTFDLLATGTDTLVVDSLSAQLFTTGLQTVVAYYRRGSQAGYANQPSAWTRWDSATVNVSLSGELYVLDFADLSLVPGDTLGVYLHLQASSARLSYVRSAAPLVYSDGVLSLIGGSGVSYTFGTLYTPRNWGGRVHYHYGYNAAGYCQTPRRAVTATVEEPTLFLGADTSVVWGQPLVLSAGMGFAAYAWSDGSTGATLSIDSSRWSLGSHVIWVDATTAAGCTVRDSIIVHFGRLTTVGRSREVADFMVYPNPSSGQVWVKSGDPLLEPLHVYNAQGQCVFVGSQVASQTVDLEGLPSGLYWIFAVQTGQTVQKALFLQD